MSVLDKKTMDFYEATSQDLEGIVSQLRSIKGVECAISCMKREFWNIR